ncbi:unnamed protein product [Fusarium graminearum]|uniref:Chromosome 1, complete genome n=4 Tax=cellular organisms TaxID=131567 RepID=A0A1C3YIB6_GIBZE|nr:unnamed protein product [Fusarium graminearum]CAF3608504.1 unnamed protein product [Fusarium graminearum]CAG1968944.1 unnamed protein product [Fusarium graminearum]CAG1975687.1 unnamed protein product [Fusarium graminearum]CAG2004140.1 unnamed protein product [Fusarium graminearum]
MGSCKRRGSVIHWYLANQQSEVDANHLPIAQELRRPASAWPACWRNRLDGHASAQPLTVITRNIRSQSNLKASYTTILRNQHFHQTTISNMPSYIITCKDDASDEQVQSAKQHAKDQGGKITHEYSLIKGFAVEFPEDSIQTLESHEHIKTVEADGEMRTQ